MLSLVRKNLDLHHAVPVLIWLDATQADKPRPHTSDAAAAIAEMHSCDNCGLWPEGFAPVKLCRSSAERLGLMGVASA